MKSYLSSFHLDVIKYVQTNFVIVAIVQPQEIYKLHAKEKTRWKAGFLAVVSEKHIIEKPV